MSIHGRLAQRCQLTLNIVEAEAALTFLKTSGTVRNWQRHWALGSEASRRMPAMSAMRTRSERLAACILVMTLAR